mmetsp:Transcript_32636/g.70664  ORF Transcript_32636/g.70664 Transcript_32636/m.70664 type:complete len:160 (+) Transcript_32636:912-1391(+)
MDADVVLYPQWLPGIINIVAHVLSRDFHLTNTHLLDLLRRHVPHQLPPSFRICPLPPTIVSFLTSFLERRLPTTQSPKAPQRSKLVRGDDGSTTSDQSNSTPTPSSTSSSPINASRYSEPSQPQCARDAFQDRLIADWLAGQCAIPWTKYHRPFGLRQK